MDMDDTMNSEFEVINESSREGSPMQETLLYDPTMSQSVDYSQELSDRLLMLASFSSEISGYQPRRTSSPIQESCEQLPSTSKDDPNVVQIDDMSIVPKSLNESVNSSGSIGSIDNYQQETKLLLQKAINQMEDYSNEKRTMAQKISELESKVDRLATKNYKLQKSAPRSLVKQRSFARQSSVERKTVEIQTDAVPSSSRSCGFSFAWMLAIGFFAVSIGLASMLNQESENARELFAKLKSMEDQLGKTEEFAEKSILRGCLTDIIEINPEYSEEEALNMLRRSTTGYIPDLASCNRLRDLLSMKQHMETILREQLQQYRYYVHASAGITVIIVFLGIMRCLVGRTDPVTPVQ